MYWSASRKLTLNGLKAIANTPFILALSMWTMLILGSSDFLVIQSYADAQNDFIYTDQPNFQKDPRRDDVEELKKRFFYFSYLLTAILCLAHRPQITSYFKKNTVLLVMLVMLIATSVVSLEPISVIANTIQILIGILAAMLLTLGSHRYKDGRILFLAVFWATIPIVASSLILIPVLDLDIILLVNSSLRYGGFSGNPNTLGAVSALLIWASFSLLVTTDVSMPRRIFRVASITAAMFGIALSGSGTSAVVAVLITVTFAWQWAMSFISVTRELVIYISAVLVTAAIAITALFYYTPSEVLGLFVDGLGKDTTLTGRTELWGIALEAIQQKWLFGWGFDSHVSVKSVPKFDILFNHYHNGYLDVLIIGGVPLLSVAFYTMYRYLVHYIRARVKHRSAFPLLHPLLLLIVFNMSEYSLIRPLSPIWHIYLCAFVLLSTYELNAAKTGKPLQTMIWEKEFERFLRRKKRKGKHRRAQPKKSNAIFNRLAMTVDRH